MLIYGSCLCTDSKINEILFSGENKPGIQVQKFNRLVVEGLMANDQEIIQISAVPVSRAITKRLFFPKKRVVKENKTELYVPLVNLPLLKDVFLFLYVLIHVGFSKDTVSCRAIVCDILSPTLSYALALISKVRKIPFVSIITDFPEFVTDNSLFNFLAYQSIRLSDGYILMTDQMIERLDGLKPYRVIEGMTDMKFVPSIKSALNHERKQCLYAGNLSVSNGIAMLNEAFKNIPEADLHLYGTGDFANELSRQNISNIHYHGIVKNEVVVLKQMEMDLLINPRPTKQEFTLYSFPSKLMEYMLSGTPALTTRLRGITSEYENCMYYFDEETSEGFEKKIREVLNKNESELAEFGRNAQLFVMNHKTNQIQMRKLLDLIEYLSKR